MRAGKPLSEVQRQKNLHLFRQPSRPKGIGAAENQLTPGKGMLGGTAATSKPQQGDANMGPRTQGYRRQTNWPGRGQELLGFFRILPRHFVLMFNLKNIAEIGECREGEVNK